MAYDPAYSEPADWDNELVTDTKLNQMKDNTHHNYKYKLATGDGTPNLKMARGVKQFTISTGNFTGSATITFATDADDGDPAFSNTPRITYGLEYVSGAFSSGGYNFWFRNLTTTTFEMLLSSDTAHAADLTVRVHWQAIGD